MVSQLMKPLGPVWDAPERKRRLDSRPFFMRFATPLLLYLSVFPACACILPTPCRLSVPGEEAGMGLRRTLAPFTIHRRAHAPPHPGGARRIALLTGRVFPSEFFTPGGGLPACAGRRQGCVCLCAKCVPFVCPVCASQSQ